MRTILVAVDGTERGLEAVAVLGRLLKGRKDLALVLLHCVQQVATLLPGDLCRDVERHARFARTDQEEIGNVVLGESLRRLTEAGFPGENVEMRLRLDSMDPARDILTEADRERIQTIALGRRGRSQMEDLLLGSISGKVAQYGSGKSVWIVDAAVNETGKVLVALEGVPESRALSSYAADFFAACPGFRFAFLHLMPRVPPTFWDDGHIMGDPEQKDRQARIEKWKSEWTGRVDMLMSEARGLLLEKGVPDRDIKTITRPIREGIGRDLLDEIHGNRYQVVVMGKKSFHYRKAFLMGSHASKILQNVKAAVLCLVGS